MPVSKEQEELLVEALANGATLCCLIQYSPSTSKRRGLVFFNVESVIEYLDENYNGSITLLDIGMIQQNRNYYLADYYKETTGKSLGLVTLTTAMIRKSRNGEGNLLKMLLEVQTIQ